MKKPLHLIDPSSRDPLPIDHMLDVMVEKQGTYSSTLSWQDRLRLRKITKMIHMKLYPKELVTDREADKMIDVMGPQTERYLIERMWDKVK